MIWLSAEMNFNSRPHEEVDYVSVYIHLHSNIFQLTTSRRGRLLEVFAIMAISQTFQLTTSRRGRRAITFIVIQTAVFQLTTSRRGRLIKKAVNGLMLYFNSRPHEEVDCDEELLKIQYVYFNSRPHEEVDHSTQTAVHLAKYFNSRPHEEVDKKEGR